jgi:hypothetical protein
MKIKNFRLYKSRIETIYNLLITEIAPSSSTEDNYIRFFLKSLFVNDVNNIRLLACLGIDTKTCKMRFTKDLFVYNEHIALIRLIILEGKKIAIPKTFNNKLPAVYQFWISLKNIDISNRVPSIRCEGNCSLSRIVTFDSYIKYCVEENNSVNQNHNKIISFDPNELNTYYQKFTEGKYCNINIARLGRENSWVFVADMGEINDYLQDKTIPKLDIKVANLIDRLGFYIEEIDPLQKYVALYYPNNFEEQLYQSSTTSGDWGRDKDNSTFTGNEFFMSYKNIDDWGRTFSVSGKLTHLRERVHKSFDHQKSKRKKYKFKGVDLKTINNLPYSKATPEIIVHEILNRFETI